jgi:serine protease Do
MVEMSRISKDFPDLVIEIVEYFSLNQGDINNKSILGFCERYTTTDERGNKELLFNITDLITICDILCKHNIMTRMKLDVVMGINNNYCSVIRDQEAWKGNRISQSIRLNAMVFGFKYIYDLYKDTVFPIEVFMTDDSRSLGTCFRFLHGIITAKHCLFDDQDNVGKCRIKNISIKGYTGKMLSSAKIYISQNKDIDLAYITEIPVNHTTPSIDEGKVLDDVLVMGYPRVPNFHCFLTAEKATISSISSASDRLTPTRGAIAAIGSAVSPHEELMLITARIRGGNSGGPVIGSNGCVVGVSTSLPYGEGLTLYDDMGYGVAYPISHAVRIANEKNEAPSFPNGFFQDFVE